MLWESVSVVEGRYVVCCVLEDELKECGHVRDRDHLMRSCVDLGLLVGLGRRSVPGNAMCR